MGIFNGYLICSDIDGTFTSLNGAEAVNAEAVKYFTENGGRFTFATGRMIDHLKEKGLSRLINAPACLSNGAFVYDYESERTLRDVRLDFSCRDFVRYAKDIMPPEGTVQAFVSAELGISEQFTLSEADELFPREPSLPDAHPLKVVCRFPTKETADEFKARAMHTPFLENCYISKSWAYGVEFNSADGTKGAAVEFLKHHLDDVHTVIAIGDYENDVTMIECADIGVAVGGAVDSVLSAADMTVARASEYAIRDLIEKLEAMIRDKSIESYIKK